MKTFEYFPPGLTDNMVALVWSWSRDNPSSDAMLVCCTNADMRLSASMGYLHLHYWSYTGLWLILFYAKRSEIKLALFYSIFSTYCYDKLSFSQPSLFW